MTPETLDTVPYWSTSSFPRFPKLTADTSVDVVVVGAGITGLTAAYILATEGRSVLVLERGRCAGIDTGHTTAHLTMVTDTRLGQLVKRFGRSHAQAVWDAGLAAIAHIDEVVRRHDLACDFEWVSGYLHAPADDAGAKAVESLQADAELAAELGFDAAFQDEVPLVGLPGIRFDGQARFHPRKYLAGIAAALAEAGGRIVEHSEAAEFAADPLSVTANGHRVTCGEVIIATHNPIVGVGGIAGAALFQTKLALYTSYAVAGRLRRGTVPDCLWWDTSDPYRYLRVQPDGEEDLVILGGEDHKTGQEPDPESRYARLAQGLAALVPGCEVAHRWSGQVIETPDGLPYIGTSAEHQYSATGFSGNGMTFGTLAGMMIADRILGGSNPWSDLFDPGRKAIKRGLWDYVKENTDYPYYLIRDRFAGVEGRSLRVVKRGEGKIIEREGKKVAVYRDPSGAVSIRSATCTHMACLVAWNEAEKTWDCPCHGSRFTPGGQVIAGPAESPLSEV